MNEAFHNLLLEEAAFLICDVETTGSTPAKDKIIELAIVQLQNQQIEPLFAELINPQQHIPRIISRITGIFDYHVFSRPPISAFLHNIDGIFRKSNAVFVAHNAQFDWKFLSATFASHALSIPEIPRLCTYRLARRLLPKNRKYNLEALAHHFSIAAKRFHRAFDDAFVTAQVLQKLLEIAEEKHGITTVGELLHFQYKPLTAVGIQSVVKKKFTQQFQTVPEIPGVYFFKDASETILYIGKARNLKKRISSYLTNPNLPEKISRMLREATTIDWIPTETELSALLLESQLIKQHQPVYNTLSKRYQRYTYMKLALDRQFPNIECTTEFKMDHCLYYGPFRTATSAEQLKNLLDRFFCLRRCTGEIAPSSTNRPCLDFYIQRCLGPCVNAHVTTEYRTRIQQLIDTLEMKPEDIVGFFQQLLLDHSNAKNYEDAQKIVHQLRELQSILAITQKGIASNIAKRNVIILTQSDVFRNKVEIYFIQSGLLMYQRLIGKRLPLQELRRKYNEVYIGKNAAPLFTSLSQTTNTDTNAVLSDHIRIVMYWINQQLNTAHFIPINDTAKEEEVIEKIARTAYTLLQ